jgi:succinylarginine dihydrolase
LTAGQKGLQIFTFGRRAWETKSPTQFPARQTHEASEAIARLHKLNLPDVLFIRQNPKAIDAGAFHNDVVAVGHRNVLLYHQAAFAESIDPVRRWFEKSAAQLHAIEVGETDVSLADAISSYLFNSQLVTDGRGEMALIAPTDARDCPSAGEFLENLPGSGGPIRRVHFVDVRQSMDNGGGPACLRLRVELTQREMGLVLPGVFLTGQLYAQLQEWIQKHYRDRLAPGDLADPQLLDESRGALDELTRILGLGSIYSFQRAKAGQQHNNL